MSETHNNVLIEPPIPMIRQEDIYEILSMVNAMFHTELTYFTNCLIHADQFISYNPPKDIANLNKLGLIMSKIAKHHSFFSSDNDDYTVLMKKELPMLNARDTTFVKNCCRHISKYRLCNSEINFLN